ncbi:hypothetical protein K5Q02_22200 [Pseudomonas sp. MM211]|uniref:hypothetical protein n=1 Tax=Pseudomonas sp. MM211 TaxID=2866808 RepID=UPI001CEC34CD|nr:hypothetical protein [Pseudomonas sp. MM211]UCJ16460.1 hypothetical protein K5Q02_22200 [Pseudomonas sp. MM211]
MIKSKDTDPKAFERYFKDIVKLHYSPANYRDVPDNQGGDFGIECYTISGHAFQCYLPEQTTDIAKLVAAQKAKINKDTKKLSDKKDKLERLFGSTKICRWILATSAHKSAEITAFCAQKSLEIRNLGLNYIDSDFQVLIHTEEDYKLEAEALSKQAYQLNIDFEKHSAEKVESWIDTNLTFLSKLDKKLPKIIGDEEKVKRIKNDLVNKYLDYQNLLNRLLQDWADIYEIIVTSVQHRQNYLETRFLVSPDLLPNEVIKQELQKLDDDLSREIRTLKRTDIELIKWGVVSDWLIRCPLDF